MRVIRVPIPILEAILEAPASRPPILLTWIKGLFFMVVPRSVSSLSDMEV